MGTRARYTAALLLLACAPLVLAPPAVAQPTTADPAAREAAESWMALLAAEDFQTSWDEAGELFKAGTTAEEWAAQAAYAYRRIGDVVARELAELRAVTDPPDAPPADYVHIRYRTEFSVVGTATEMIVLIREDDRGWRVIGYFVQPSGT